MRFLQRLRLSIPDLLAPKRSAFCRYGGAFLALSIAFSIRYLLSPLLGNYAPFILFVPAVIIAAWFGGFVPAVLAIFASFLLADYFFVAPPYRWSAIHTHEIIATVVYVFTASVVTGLMEALRREQQYTAERAELLRIEIEQRKRVESTLRESERKYRSLYLTTPVMLHSIDQEGRLLSVSDFWLNSLGYQREEVIGQKSSQFLTPESQRFAREVILPKFFQTGICTNVPYQMIRKDGSIIDVLLSAIAERDAQGNIISSMAVRIDVTTRKKAEQALRASENRLRVLADTAVDAILSADFSGKITQFNQAAEQIFGYKAQEALGQSLLILVPLPLRGLYQTQFEKFMAAEKPPLIGRTTEMHGVRKDGSEFPAEISLSSWQTEDGKFLTAIVRDITERKRAEDALRQSEELLRLTTEAANVGLWSWDLTANKLEWNAIEYRQFGLSPRTPVTVETFFNAIHPEDRGWMRDRIERCLRDGCELDVEHRIILPDGAIRWNQCRGKPFYLDGKPVRISGMSLDMTERRHAQEIVRQQNELLKLAQVLAFGLDEKILFWNPGAERLYDWTREEAIGRDAHELLRTEFPEPLEQIKQTVITHGSWEGELNHFRKDGEKICVASHWALFRDPENRPVSIMESNNNITRLKKAEAALAEAKEAIARHAENLEVCVAQRTAELQRSLKDMESFCYTIAHDLRAPLRAMSGFSYSLAEDFAEKIGPVGIDYCERINAASARMSQLISDLLVYGRLSHRELPVQPVDLLAEVNKVLERTAQQIQERNAEINVEKPLPKVCGDAPLIDQILENLLSNAVKFVPADRRPRVHIFAEHRNSNVRLCIEDNGIGIPQEHWQKIFQPFERLHTVEYPGTGIGLAIVQRGVEKMGGQVGVESTPDHGSRFWVELPKRCRRQ